MSNNNDNHQTRHYLITIYYYTKRKNTRSLSGNKSANGTPVAVDNTQQA